MSLHYSKFKHRIDVDALEQAIGFDPLRQESIEDVGYCVLPWGLHKNGDTTGKLAINRDKLVYNCWVCGGGSLLDLAMATQDLDIDEATEWLYQFAKSETKGSHSFLHDVEAILREERSEVHETLPFFNERVLDKWTIYDNEILVKIPVQEWLGSRGISLEVAEFFKLGYNAEATRGDFTGKAIIFPHFWRGRLVGWQQRWLDRDAPKKYTNTKDLPRKTTLWGYDFCLAQSKPPVVVESIPTAMFLITHGVPALATFGAEVTTPMMRHLRIFQQGVRLAPDNDQAGRESANRVGAYLSRFIPVSIIEPPDKPGSDLGDLHKNPDLALNKVEEAIPYGIQEIPKSGKL